MVLGRWKYKGRSGIETIIGQSSLFWARNKEGKEINEV
jgi:hypothetical protein